MTVRSHGEGRRRKTRGVTAGVRGEGRVGDGAVETKQKQNNMKRFLSGERRSRGCGREAEAGYTKIHKEKEGQESLVGSEKQSE